MNEDYRITLRKKGYIWDEASKDYKKHEDHHLGLGATKPQHNPVRALEPSAERKVVVLGKARVRITRYGTRSCDRDNLYGCVKSLCDGLQKAGLIASDAEEAIDLDVKQVLVKHRSEIKTVIEIEDAP